MEFQNEKRIDLDKIKQKALNGGLSIEYLEDKKVQILYDFGNIIILNNETEFENLQVGAEFNYYNPWINEEGDEINIGYDLTKISGVIFIDKEKLN